MNGRGRFFLVGLLALVCQLPWSSAKAQTVEYIHTDALGTPIAVTDANRVVIERSEYEPYGKLLNRPLTDGPGFTGHVQDAATGMTYMQQRYMDPDIGRFLSVDPVTADSGTGANFNRYWYANNNPYKFTDPDGREIYAQYDLRTNTLSISDLEKGEMIEISVESGGKPWGDPIPEGQYDILDHPDQDFLRLEPRDGNYGDDTREEDGRDEFRLHRPGRTIGCIAAKQPEDWARARQLIRQTKTSESKVRSKSRNPMNKKKMETLRRFGRLRVMRSEEPPKEKKKPRPKHRLNGDS